MERTAALFVLFSVLVMASTHTVRVYSHGSEGTPGLQQFLCGSSTDLNNTTLLLSTAGTHIISPGPLCLLQYVHNLTIKADTLSGKPAIIQCRMNPLVQNTTEENLTFLSLVGITLSNIVFTGCGNFLIDSEASSNQFNAPAIQLTNVSNVILHNTSIGLPTNALSPSLRTCFCRQNWTASGRQQLCLADTISMTTYPGRSISVNVAVVDTASNAPVFSGIEVTSNFTSLQTPLGRQCTPITVPFLSNTTDGMVTISIAVADNAPSSFINVTVVDCPLGSEFNLTQKQCTCSPLIEDRAELTCNITDGTVRISGQNWLGLKDGVLAFTDLCPIGYCAFVARIGAFKLNVTDICDNNRTGIQCGRCKDGFSSTLGTDTTCYECSNLWLLTIPLFLITGVALVLVLFLLRLTISAGTINGIIFNVNIFVALDVASYSRLPVLLRPLYIGVNLLALSLGFPLCFHSDMTELEKAFLNFLFPSYLFCIVIAIIVVSRYSSWLSKHTAESSVQVLATLVFLSYASLLSAIIKIFNQNVVERNNDTSLAVWFDDGNVTYLQNPTHIVLFVLALLVYFGLVLPYTVLITAGPFMYRFKIINKFRVFLDAHYGPYKDRYRFWFGVRLWIIQLVFVAGTTLRFQFSVSLIVVLSVLIPFIVIEALIKPYRHRLQNWFDTILLLIFTLVITIAAGLIQFFALSLVFQNVAITALTLPPLVAMAMVLCYHLRLACCPKYQLPRIHKKQQYTPPQIPKQSTVLRNYTTTEVSVSTDEDGARLRESLLEDKTSTYM